jgi:hypothetical protein
MEEQIVSFETAKLAEEKGFNFLQSFTHVTSLYDKKGDHVYYTNYGMMGSGLDDGYISAPTQAFLQKWLREVHNLHIHITTTPVFDQTQGSKYKSSIGVPFQPFKWTTGHYYLGNTYEEVLEQGLIKALKTI